MCSGKDAVHFLLALLLGLVSLGCVANGGPRPARWQPQPAARGPGRSAEAVGPVALAEPRPVSPPPQSGPSPAAPNPTPPTPPAAPPADSPVSLPTPPGPAGAAADSLGELRQLHRTAAERYAGIDSYIARLRRREQVNGKNGPEEILSFKFRKHPWSVHFKWLSDPGKGREVVYVQGRHGGNIHTLLAAGDIPLMRGGMRVALPPNDPRVLARSRHPITEAGIGSLIDRFGDLLAAQEAGDRRRGTLTYLGPQTRPDYLTPEGQPATLEAVEHAIPPGSDPNLPRGGRRMYYFDPTNGLPVLVVTRDDRGQEVEYYCFDLFLFNVKLDDDDFDPDKLWHKR
ncbi:MAG TPA: DUF1571 domain-containing protein [Gemmataceae bacterium]|nr:DUF1571 domain-containing protein [Gemmataceae bacterium]